MANYQDFGYLGQPFDPISGLELFRARWYAPDLGRFTAIDPMGAVFGSPATINRYAYALNNPSTFSDPSGLFVREALDTIVTSIPYIGAAYLLITAITGYDPILGRQLSPLERVMNAAFGLAGLIEPIGVGAGAGGRAGRHAGGGAGCGAGGGRDRGARRRRGCRAPDGRDGGRGMPGSRPSALVWLKRGRSRSRILGEKRNNGSSGPVTFRPAAGATPEEIA